MALSTASTNAYMGFFTCSSNTGLRGWNHSRLLLRASPRKNCMASPEKPGNGDFTKNASLIIEVMPSPEETHARLAGIPNLTVSRDTPLSRYTRFGIGGPADIYAETESESVFMEALAVARSS